MHLLRTGGIVDVEGWWTELRTQLSLDTMKQWWYQCVQMSDFAPVAFSSAGTLHIHPAAFPLTQHRHTIWSVWKNMIAEMIRILTDRNCHLCSLICMSLEHPLLCPAGPRLDLDTQEQSPPLQSITVVLCYLSVIYSASCCLMINLLLP